MRKPLELLAMTFIAVLAPAARAQAPIVTLKKVAEFDLPGPAGKRLLQLALPRALSAMRRDQDPRRR